MPVPAICPLIPSLGLNPIPLYVLVLIKLCISRSRLGSDPTEPAFEPDAEPVGGRLVPLV